MSNQDVENCLFCKIINKQLPADIIFEDDNYIVFKDINPKADLHLLMVPKEHIKSLANCEAKHANLLGNALLKLDQIAKDHNYPNGFRTIINTGPAGGQVVHHIHVHLLAGKLMAFG